MSEQLTVNVTADHIAAGERQDATSCAIALALLELGYENVNVEDPEAEMVDPQTQHWLILPLPKEAIDFIAFFDNGDEVQPFSFTTTLEYKYEDDDSDGDEWDTYYYVE